MADQQNMDATKLRRAWRKVRDQEVLVFFDPGSRANFISPQLASKLGIRAEEMGMTGEARLACSDHSELVTRILVREVFSDFGNVLDVVFLKDKKTGMSQGCCFIKYSSVVDAERAIRALDNQRTLKGASEPLQVKFADGDRDHSGPLEHKLFVGSVSRQANEQDIEEVPKSTDY
ncbi:hypothetical protein L7F22_002740 [Adiantum nelumboides]|nr:hypothetical protein [Adiantum nelumboides]